MEDAPPVTTGSVEDALTTDPALCSTHHSNRVASVPAISTDPGMESERLIASLYARRRRLILSLQDFERRVEVYRSAIAEIETKLMALRRFVLPFRSRGGYQYFTSREFSRGYYDAIREQGKTLTADDVAIFLMRRKELAVSDTVLRKSIRRRVVELRRRMRRRGGPA